jgi:hypothetical protein
MKPLEWKLNKINNEKKAQSITTTLDEAKEILGMKANVKGLLHSNINKETKYVIMRLIFKNSRSWSSDQT